MSKITDEILRAVMPNAPAARRKLFLPFLNESALRFGITNELRLAAWLATLAAESGELRYTKELASGDAYDTRTDLGNTPQRDGDGRKYKGRGLIQDTGKDLYTKVSKYFGVDFLKNPELLETPRWACLSAGHFVAVYKTGMHALADQRNFLAYSVKVNGRNRKTKLPNHWDVRKAYYERALRVIPDDWKLTVDDIELPDDISAEPVKVKRLPDNQYPDYEVKPGAPVDDTSDPNDPEIVDHEDPDDEAKKITGDPVAGSEAPGADGGTSASMQVGPDGKVQMQGSAANAEPTKVAIEKAEKVGFLKTIWKKVTAAVSGNIGLQSGIEYAQQANTLGLPSTTWRIIGWLILGGTLIWLAFEAHRYWIVKRDESHLTDKLIDANSSNDIVKMVSKADFEAFRKEGYHIVTR